MTARLRYIVGLCFLLCMLSGCLEEVPFLVDDPETDGVQVPFSLSVQHASGVQTKMTEGVVQSEGVSSFRGIEKVYAIPFSVNAPVTGVSERISENLVLPQQGLPAKSFASNANYGSYAGLVQGNNAHLYNMVFLKRATRSALVYGKALDEPVEGSDSIAFKHRNGSLRASGLTDCETPQDIAFTLEPIIDGTTAKKAFDDWRDKTVLAFLNDIAKTTVKISGTNVSYQFRDTASYNYHPGLCAALKEFTGDGRVFSGSSDVIGQKLTKLYADLSYYGASNLNSADYHRGNFFYVYRLSQAVCNYITTSSAATKYVDVTTSGGKTTITLKQQAPASFGLPSGCLTVQWRKKESPLSSAFGTPDSAAGIGTAPCTVYCYPPSLWYRSNSQLVTTVDETVLQQYKSDNPTWEDILDYYPDDHILSDTRAAALQDQLQYAVSMLNVTIARRSANLQDWMGKSVDINNKNYPLTGVLVGGQRAVGFDFQPEGETYYTLYDSDVNTIAADGTATPRAYISRNTNSQPVRVLTLQNAPEEDVYFALEFKNASKNAFTGINGQVVYPGCHFYLIGALEYSKAANASGDPLDCVFVQDYESLARVTVSSLAAAYTTMPDLTLPQLHLGVDVVLNWELSTPESIAIR